MSQRSDSVQRRGSRYSCQKRTSSCGWPSRKHALLKPQAKKRTPQGNTPTTKLSQLQGVVELWHRAAAGGHWKSDRLRELREVVAATSILPEPPTSTDEGTWRQWASTAIAQAEGLLVQGRVSLTFRGGTWCGLHAAENASRSLRQSTSDMFSELRGGDSGGGIDALMVDFDEITGAAMPQVTHDGLARHVCGRKWRTCHPTRPTRTPSLDYAAAHS
jgi:hypothetical protein